MNLLKVQLLSLISMISISAGASVDKKDMMKSYILQQLKPFNPGAVDNGKTLKKAASVTTNEIFVTDSVEAYSWNGMSWRKDNCCRYFYDGYGRITQEITTSILYGTIDKIAFEYDPDGITVKRLSIAGLSPSLGGPDTVISVMKWYPGYSGALPTLYSTAEMTATNFNEIMSNYELDSMMSIGIERGADGQMDTIQRTSIRYTKTGSMLTGANTTLYSNSLDEEPLSYSVKYYYSGNGVIDTIKWIYHFDMQSDNEFFEVLKKMQYLMMVMKTEPQNNVTEVISGYGSDSSYSDFFENSKMYYYSDASGNADSTVSMEWDTVQKTWNKIEKSVYSYKKITVGVKKSYGEIQTSQQVTFKLRNGNLHLTVPDGTVVKSIEQLDLQGKVISKTPITEMKRNCIECPHFNSANAVSFLRLNTDRGKITGKISSVK